MPEPTQPDRARIAEQEVWLGSLTSLAKRLVAPPAKVDEKTPAGDER